MVRTPVPTPAATSANSMTTVMTARTCERVRGTVVMSDFFLSETPAMPTVRTVLPCPTNLKLFLPCQLL